MKIEEQLESANKDKMNIADMAMRVFIVVCYKNADRRPLMWPLDVFEDSSLSQCNIDLTNTSWMEGISVLSKALLTRDLNLILT